jgi:anti-anti-sigma factor
MSLLNVAVTKSGDRVFTVSLKGSIDSDTYMILDDKMDDILKSRPMTLVFDMSNVDYISSMGIGSLLGAKIKVEDLGGTLVMVNLQPQIRKVLDIVKMMPTKNIFSNREELDQYLAAMQRKEKENWPGQSKS